MADEEMSSFWRMTFGNVLTILVMVGGLLIFFLSYDHQIRDSATGLAAQVKSSDAALLVVNDRLKALEESRMKLIVIDEKLNQITEWIKEQKELARQSQIPITSNRGK